MAQIIKHRRGSISQLKDVTAKVGELVMATGSISDLNGPFIFIGETENAAGGYRTVSKLYSGNAAPTISNVSYGTVLDGTPFYAAGNETLYILSSGGNTALDLTGNIEGNTISGVTINNLSSTNVSASFFTGSFKGDGTNLFNIPASGVTGLNLSMIASGAFTASISEVGGFNVNTDTEITGTLVVTDDVTFEKDLYVSGNIYQTGSYYTQGNIVLSGSINIGDNLTGDTINFGGEVNSNILPTTGSTYDLGSSGKTWNNIWAENAHFENIEIGDITLNDLSLPGDLTVSGTTTLSGSVYVEDLTEKRLVVVGEDGLLTNYSGLTFDNGNLNVSGAIEVTNIQGTGSLYLKPDLDDPRLFEIYNSLAPSGYTDIHFVGNADFNFFGDDTNYLKIDNTISKISIESSGGVDIITSGSLNIKTEDGNDLLVSSSSDLNLEADTDISITAGDDLRLYANDTFVLRNYSSTDPIQLVTQYDSGNEKTMSFDVDGNLTIPGGFTGSFANLSSGATITGSLIVSDGSGLFNSSLIANNSNLTLDNGSNIEMNLGHIYFNEGCGDIYYNTTDSELTIDNTCGDIRLNKDTYTNNDIYIENDNTLYTNNVTGHDSGDLNLNAVGGVYINSTTTREIELGTENAESGSNYVNVNNDGVYLSTYDFTSNLTHKVLLDNTGSLKLENVSLSLTGSLGVSGSLDVYGPTHIHNDLYVSGNLAILGSGSVVHISASQVDIGTNIINLNTFAPFERFAGLAVYDSGSNVGVTGSLLWDSTNNVWIYSHPDHLGSVASARLISGPLNTGSLGNETGLTNGHFPIATGDDHISDSLLTYIGTTLSLNTNKFTVDSETGDTLINGNFTIEGVGGTDNGNYSSYIVFRNDDDVLGFVGTNDTTNVTDRLLGYNSSTGVLEFSSLIDGGTY
jgi:cytoskeletal protein CcmA (bactofilin family)